MPTKNSLRMRKETKNWLKMAEYDSTTADHMLASGRYVYVVFMCHLSIKKMLKAIASEETGKTPPKTHNLLYLLKLSKITPPQSLHDFISIINNASIPTRYPEDFDKLIEVYPKEIAHGYLDKTQEVLQWLKQDHRLKES
ncbi:MAG: HEPN domain-containing protein [Deltaproteobacteria bacterium]|nr:HEPN domain-containing protein [Deltaproteobacteria bacterium]